MRINIQPQVKVEHIPDYYTVQPSLTGARATHAPNYSSPTSGPTAQDPSLKNLPMFFWLLKIYLVRPLTFFFLKGNFLICVLPGFYLLPKMTGLYITLLAFT